MAGIYNLYIPICGLLVAIICNVVFFSKERAKNKETAIFSRVLIYSLVDSILMVVIICLALFSKDSLKLMEFLNKVDYAMYILFSSNLFLYVYYVTSKEDETQKVKLYNFFFYLTTVIDVILMILLLFMKVDVHIDGSVMYSDGLALSSTIIGCSFYFLAMIVCLIINFKKAISRKLTPLYALIGFFALVFALNQIDQTIVIISAALAYVNLIMLFTIENPDIKLVQQLEIAREHADKANQAKTEFLSSMSHEIRTPLNAIVGFSGEILESENLEEAQENAKDIVNASDTLLEIVNGILDISKIEAGKIEIINSPYNAPETFEELAKLITPKMTEKGLDFSYNIAPDLPGTLYGDHANLKKVVTNFLSNAYKYTDKGYVHYEVNCVNSNGVCKLIISVEDSGRGIRNESVDKMFTKFQRLDEDKNTTIEGTGLGLAITKQLTELMGGRVFVHTVYGQGSKFTVVINQKIENVQVQKKKKIDTTIDLKDVRILLVDDTPLNLKVAAKLLARYGANQIDTCISGFECLDKIKSGEKYDVILLDDMMPKLSGTETLNQLREIEGFNTPVVALTANAITGMREKYLADGFDDYLAKPIEKEQLTIVLNKLLGKSSDNDVEELEVSQSQEVVDEETEQNKKEIIPVEENIEELLGDQLDMNYSEEDNMNSEELNNLVGQGADGIRVAPPEEVNLATDPFADDDKEATPVVEGVYDRNYLESKGVNMEQALDSLGDMEMYNATMSDFLSEVETKWADLVKYKEENNMPEYAVLVHSLKSDCKYLGFMDLADIAYQHELKSKENDTAFVNEHFAELEEKYNKVLEIAKEYVNHQ